METNKHMVYIIKCNDGTLYTGYTNNLERRLKMHEQGKGAKYTRGRGPFRVVYVKGYPSKEIALQNEYKIKQLTRQQKLELIDQNERSDDL